jgi:HD-like signal output (HDOD) protein
MKSELIEMIEKIQMLPETIQKVDEVFKNPTTTTGDMVKALYSDPLLIARILKLANSPLFGLSRTVTDIAHAVALLGRDVVHIFVVVSIIDETMDLNISPYGLTKENYLDRAQIQHAIGSGLASKISMKSLPMVSLGSYLLGLGRVVISRYLIETNQADAFSKEFQEG